MRKHLQTVCELKSVALFESNAEQDSYAPFPLSAHTTAWNELQQQEKAVLFEMEQ